MRINLCMVSWIFAVLLLEFRDVITLKNVILTIQPRIVQYLNDSTLRCSYDLEDDVLYSVKWYRGLHEFYRYTPSEHPHTKVFPIGGIKVDTSRSNSTQVVLKTIDFNLSGNFTCEVTTDSPHNNQGVGTQSAIQSMLVVQLPDFPPKISVEGEPFDYGDILRANCSSPPSRPPVILKFMLNDMMIAQSDPFPSRNIQERAWSDLALELPLSDVHFSEGRLILRCVASLMDIYYEEAKLELRSVRNPVPEKVRGYTGLNGTHKDRNSHVLIIAICLCFYSVITKQ